MARYVRFPALTLVPSMSPVQMLHMQVYIGLLGPENRPRGYKKSAKPYLVAMAEALLSPGKTEAGYRISVDRQSDKKSLHLQVCSHRAVYLAPISVVIEVFM
jgi:hypothetical protein